MQKKEYNVSYWVLTHIFEIFMIFFTPQSCSRVFCGSNDALELKFDPFFEGDMVKKAARHTQILGRVKFWLLAASTAQPMGIRLKPDAVHILSDQDQLQKKIWNFLDELFFSLCPTLSMYEWADGNIEKILKWNIISVWKIWKVFFLPCFWIWFSEL